MRPRFEPPSPLIFPGFARRHRVGPASHAVSQRGDTRLDRLADGADPLDRGTGTVEAVAQDCLIAAPHPDGILPSRLGGDGGVAHDLVGRPVSPRCVSPHRLRSRRDRCPCHSWRKKAHPISSPICATKPIDFSGLYVAPDVTGWHPYHTLCHSAGILSLVQAVGPPEGRRRST
jgi:hypothetical protein